MRRMCFALTLLAAVLVTEMSGTENYVWLTNWETPALFPGTALPFRGGDTLWGPVHSNDWIATMNAGGQPVFYDVVSTTKPSFRPGSPNPAGIFLGGPPEFSVPPIMLPPDLERLRTLAMVRSANFEIDGQEWFAELADDTLYVAHWPVGTPRDTMLPPSYSLDLVTHPHVFFDGPLDVRGVLNPNELFVTIGSSENIRVLDNAIIAGTDTVTGLVPADATSALCLASERSIIIANTWENGRENSSSGSNVVITAMLYATRGSLEFEQMNDVADPYVSPVTPDERGALMITGGIVQWRRGFVHRSNNNGTGYRLKLRYDERLRYWDAGVSDENALYPDTLFFVDTRTGETGYDTLVIEGNGAFSGALASYPFATNATYQFAGPFTVPVSFTPPFPGPHTGVLSFFIGGQYHSIALRGNGVSGAPPIAPEIYPNPFNNFTSLSFNLPETAHVCATVYDVLGREVARLADEAFIAGQHRLSVQATAWSSGVYFLRFETLGQIETRKMLLIK